MDVDKIAFVCRGNAGRSQFATAFAEIERDRRDIDVEIVTGGTAPNDTVHEDVVAVLAEENIDISDRTPRKIQPDDVADADYVVTMGCSVAEFTPTDWRGTKEEWELDHPSAGDVESARSQRDEIRARVEHLFDTLTAA